MALRRLPRRRLGQTPSPKPTAARSMTARVLRLQADTGAGDELLETIESFFVDSDLAASTVKVYERTLEAMVEHFGSEAHVQDIDRAELSRFLKGRWDKTQATTYNRNLATIGSFFTWCEEHDLVVVSPARKLRRKKVKVTRESERQQRPIPIDDLQALWSDPMFSLRERALWAMLYETAARANEILSLNIEHLDLPNKEAVVIGKGGDAEGVYWASTSARLLPKLVKGRSEGPLFLTDRKPRTHVLPASADICPTTGRARLSYRRAEELFVEATAGKTLHQLRHSALTHLAVQGVETPLLKAKSRHRSMRSLERYIAPGPDDVKQTTADHDLNRRAK